MNHVTRWLISVVSLLFLLALGPYGGVEAEASEDTYSIHIVKYEIKEETQLAEDVPMTGSKVDVLKDSQGNLLKKVEGIEYHITRLQLKSGLTDLEALSSYEPATEALAFEMTVKTNQHGEATINGLPEGNYQVVERPSSLLKQVMAPVLVKLPLITKEGLLESVYLYPKSSIVSNTDLPDTKGPTKIPQTSGSIGKNYQLLGMMGLIVMMGGIGLRFFKASEHK